VMSRLHRGRRLLQSWLMEYGRKRGLVGERAGDVPARPVAGGAEGGQARPGGEP
jgi:hypothetical protein